VLGLLAGATADIFDRRRLLLFWQAWMLCAVALLSLLTLTLLLNVGTAMNSPAWQAIMPELVPREQLPEAVSLNSAGFNLARALGPALGGIAIAFFVRPATGEAWTFLLNSLSFAGVILVLYQWKRNPLFKSALPAERIYGSMRAGLRYVQFGPLLKATLARVFVFATFVSAVWSLLAVVAARDLHQGALGYGILNGSMGLGAVIGATFRYSCSQASHGPALCPHLILPCKSPRRVGSRLAPWVSIGWFSQVALAIGSVIWGLIAAHVSTPVSLAVSAAGLLITLPLTHRLHVLRGELPDFSPSISKSLDPELAIEPKMSDSPVRILIDYDIDHEGYNVFVHAIHEMKNVRLHDGAMRWGI
jgi:MFS family permease